MVIVVVRMGKESGKKNKKFCVGMRMLAAVMVVLEGGDGRLGQ